jgi:apolipoprotein N-acyltransferase
LAATGASAAAFGLYARVEWPWVMLGWCGLVPWLAVLDRAPGLAHALANGLLMAELFALSVFFWFAQAIATYTGAPLAIGVLVLLLLAPVLQPQFLVFAAARHLARRSGAGLWRTAVIGAGAYVGVEWAIPKLFADTIGHGLFASPLLRQAADLAGAPGLTFVLLIANAAAAAVVAEVAADDSAQVRVRTLVTPLAVVALLIGALCGYGARRYRDVAVAPVAAPVRAGIVQANISNYERLAAERGTYDAVALILDNYFSLSGALLRDGGKTRLDLLVWPETVYPTTFGAPKSGDGAEFDRAIAGFVERAGVPLVFGAYDADGGDEFNAAVFLEPPADGRTIFETYRKASLFPLTERVPVLLEFPIVRRWLPWLGTWTAGAGARVLPLRLGDGRTLQVAPLICYDAVDPRLAIAAARAGAELIVTLSNDAWFAGGGGPRLHLVVSAFRSLETRRPQVRATNTGISAVITPTGDLLGTIDLGARGTLIASVTPNRTAWTLMLAWGDWFGPTALVIGAALLAVSWGGSAHGTARAHFSVAVRGRAMVRRRP